jgi:hypothetical protein
MVGMGMAVMATAVMEVMEVMAAMEVTVAMVTATDRLSD